jgi:hypothetical protein
MRVQPAVLLVLALGLGAADAPADDFAPPWYRGYPLSVEAEWEFAAAPSNWYFISPDAFNSVGGSSGETLYDGFSTHAEVDDAANWGWTSGDGDGGLCPTPQDGANIAFQVQNWVDQEPYKYIRVQMTYGSPEPPVVVSATGYGSEAEGEIGPANSDGNGHTYFDIEFPCNPDWESIEVHVPCGTTLDEVYIDTVSIPEPTTLMLLALGAAAALRRR